ncbi:hypothetical protein RB195_020606 [Necator americanus]|uniref:RING-type E3 ubiquitin transferase n=1 Tax=Necator americanus TaxID=51031 RepID=A0ABR1CLC2_NECAM
MAIRRKQARGRPVKDPSPESPPPRRAKTIANANIAAQFMVDIDEPSAKMLKLDLNDSSSKDGYDSGTMVKAETDPTSSGQISDSCAICLGTRVDPTKLDNCIHSFCFTCTSQWFKYSEKCPLCMVPTKTFMHKLKSGDGEEKILVSELHTAAEAARLAERGQSQPPLDEHECIRLRIRRLQRRLSTLQNEMSKNTRDERKLEFQMANSRLVSEISRLEMLRRDATTRVDLVSDVVFRSLIYKDNLEWSSIDRNANRVAFSPAVFRANVTESTNRIRTFLDREIPIVWRNRKPRESREQYFKHRDVVVSDIVSWCGQYQINSPQFSRNLRTAGIYPNYLQRFQSELFEFASSMLTLRNFDSTSTYSSPEVRRVLERRNRRGENPDEVVTVSDSDDSDTAVIPLDDVQTRSGRHRSRRDDDVIVLSDDNLSDRDALLVRGESNYVRDEAASSNSEASNAGDFYTRPACRLPRSQIPASRDPLQVIDAFGVLREIYAGFPESRFSSIPLDSMANNLPFIFSHLGNQSRQYSRNSRSRSPIEDVNDTIVLSSEDESNNTMLGSRRQTRSMVRRKGSGNNVPSSSQDAPAANSLGWLNPSNPKSGSASSEETAHSSPQYPSKRAISSYEPSSSSQTPIYNSLLSRYPPVTPQSSPRLSENLPSTSKAEHSPGGNDAKSQDPTTEQKPRKSLFQPSAKKVMPGAKTEIRDENKLLAKLFHERQLRNAQMNHQNPQNTTEDQMDTSGTVDTTAQDSGTIGNGSVAVVPERQLDSEAAPHVSTDLEVVEVPSQSLDVSGNISAGHRTRRHSDEPRSKRHKETSWRSLFKKFRRKMKHEKNARKRERLYEFIVDMKRELEKDRSYRKKDGDYERNGEHRRYSSSKMTGEEDNVGDVRLQIRKHPKRVAVVQMETWRSTGGGGHVHILLQVVLPVNVVTMRQQTGIVEMTIVLSIQEVHRGILLLFA